MGRRPQIAGYPALLNADATVSQTSSISTVDWCDKASYHVTFSTANSGELFVEAQNNASDSWYVLDFGTPLEVDAQTEIILNINQINFYGMRLRWEPSAGAGEISAILFSAAEGA